MIFKRELWEEEFPLNEIPHWPCPTCEHGFVYLDQQSIQKGETTDSIISRNLKGWNPSWISSRLSGILICGNQKCQEKILMAGEMRCQETSVLNKEKKQINIFVEHFHPEYFFPYLKVIRNHEDIPVDIEMAIDEANKLFWTNKSACANSIRSVIDLILDDRNIPKTVKTKGGTRNKLTLHARIELFQQKNKTVGDILMAIKWIGNSGSHSQDIYNDDVLDGIELLNKSLEKLYFDEDKRLEKLTKEINKRKKPLS